MGRMFMTTIPAEELVYDARSDMYYHMRPPDAKGGCGYCGRTGGCHEEDCEGCGAPTTGPVLAGA